MYPTGVSRTSEGVSWSKHGLQEGLATAAVVAGSPSIHDKYDVIVIGAGWTGLIAARNITEQSKLSVLIVEARDRIGGRTYTANEFGRDFEMGGAWVHWRHPHVWAELHRYSMQKNLMASNGTAGPGSTFMKSNDGSVQQPDAVEEDKGQFTSSPVENLYQDFFQIDGYNSRSLMPMLHDPFRDPAPWKNYDDLSIADRLNQLRDTGKYSEANLKMLEAFSNSASCTPSDERSFIEMLTWFASSGHTLANLEEATETYKIAGGGMTKLALNVLNDYKGDLAMRAIVRKIEQTSDSANVILEDGRIIRADRIISTIPLNCLSQIAFDPPLSKRKQEAVDIGHINKGLKFHFRSSTSQQAWNIFASPDCVDVFSQISSDHNDGDECFSVAFTYSGAEISSRDPQSVVSKYKGMFSANAQPDVTGYLCHDWRDDPFAKGAWCTFRPSYMKEYQQELQKDHGRIIFASSDWADAWRGFVDGAIGQGIDAARKVLNAVKMP